jgi:hypothetical protein
MARPPLRGYNHNIRYRNRVYHVQTEDSGLENPHVFTHLFFGGVVISTARAEYADIVQEEGHEPRVQKRMQEQHKSLMKRLRHGDFDDEIVTLFGQLEGDAEEAATPAPESAAAPTDADPATEEVIVAAEAEAEGESRPSAANFPSAEAFLAEDDEDDAELLGEGDLAEVEVPEVEVPEAALAPDVAPPPEAFEEPAELEPPTADVIDAPLAESSFEPTTEETPLEPNFEPTTDEVPLDATIPQPEHLEPDLDPASLATFEQMATVAQPSEELPPIQVGSNTPGIDVSLSVGDDSLTDPRSPLDTSESPAVFADEPPPIPQDLDPEPPPRPVGSASELPPLPIEEVQAGSSEWSTNENTGRYENSLRGEQARAAGEPAPEASSPDLNFRLKLGATGSGRRESAPAIPVVRVDRTQEITHTDDEAMIIDRPEPDDSGPDDMTTSYSHVRRREGDPGSQRPSGVFNKPLPQGAQEPSASQMLGLESNPAQSRPVVPSAPPRPGGTDPRRPAAPRVHAVQGSTPQRYTAPSAKSRGRGRRATGSYEAIEAPATPRRPKARPDTRPGARAARPAAPPAKPKRPAAPARRGTGVPAAPVVARPAVVVGGNPKKRSGSGVSIAARGPKVPVAPAKRGSSSPKPPTAPKRPSTTTPRARARNLPNLFGSDLISERSLDEVILHYLAEDGEKAE